MSWILRQSAAAVFAVVLLAGCTPSSETGAGSSPEEPTAYGTLTLDEFADILTESPDDYLVINVHVPYEGEIEGTDANIRYDDLDALMATIPDKDTPVILYCRSGTMSQQAAQALSAQGYIQVWDVPGGMNAWRESGRQVLNDD